MTNTPPGRLDTLFAFKALGLSTELNGTDIRIGFILVEHVNHRTGRCDPGVQRIATLAGCSKRTVARSIEALHRANIITRSRHGGYSGRNSYQPNWDYCRELDKVWSVRLGATGRTRHVPGSTPATGQPCQVGGDSPVTQTCLDNLSNEPVSRGATAQVPSQASRHAARPKALERKTRARSPIQPVARTPSSTHVAREKAWQRCEEDLLAWCRGYTELYTQAADAITTELKDEATAHELKRRGAGIRHLVARLQAVGLILPARPSASDDGGEREER